MACVYILWTCAIQPVKVRLDPGGRISPDALLLSVAPLFITQRASQKKTKLPVIVTDMRKSVMEILGRPASALLGHHGFKADQEILALWAADCAVHVLPYFEEKYPEDDRPRKAIEELRTWVATGVFKMADVRKASLDAHAAAREVKEDDAIAAARAAGQAVATAHVLTHAFGAAAYAIKAAAAHSKDVDEGIIEERDWQLRRLHRVANV